MNNDKLLDYLIATDSLDQFLGYELPDNIKKELISVADDYKKELITDDEIQDVIMGMEIKYKINYEILFEFFKEQL